MLNKEEATAQFNQHACLVGNKDVVSENAAIEITSVNAVEFAKQICGETHNVYDIGKYKMPYLTKNGFFLAVSYQNVNEHRTKKKNPEKLHLPRTQEI